ncbi:hypothetical protein NDU88_003079 [Pleurodeles waltl]|uniref:Uncharacterized protein n=1 Tax=Pleurodeles waltl TaxID=8319 RepID=A0AAV7PC09_PLEWA|nr:hypothetical protein NDU88_003079 [Pleurodeles waltl]
MQLPFHSPKWCKIAAGGSTTAKDSGACGSGPSRQRRVRHTEWKCSDLFTTPLGTKWQPVALMLHRSLVLVVRSPPRQRRVRPTEPECSNLFDMPPGPKWQPAAVMPQRSLGLVVWGPQAA